MANVGRLLSNLGQEGFLFVFKKTNLFLNFFSMFAYLAIPSFIPLYNRKPHLLPWGVLQRSYLYYTNEFLCTEPRNAQQMTFCQKFSFLKSWTKASCVNQPWPVGWWRGGCYCYGLLSRFLILSPPLLPATALRKMKATDASTQVSRPIWGQRAGCEILANQ